MPSWPLKDVALSAKKNIHGPVTARLVDPIYL